MKTYLALEGLRSCGAIACNDFVLKGGPNVFLKILAFAVSI